MKYLLTMVTREPTEDQTDLVTHTIVVDGFLDALQILDDAEVNFTCWESVTIVPEHYTNQRK